MRRAKTQADPIAGSKTLESSQFPTQGRLMAAIGRGDEQAIRELFVLYAPLLRDQARKMNVPAAECRQFVETLLDDFVIRISQVDTRPCDLTTYLVSAVRNRAMNRHRNETRHFRREEVAYTECDDSSERVVAECHSEYGIRTAKPLDGEFGSTMSSAIAQLAHASARALTEDELTMLVGIGRHIPLRDLAVQLGFSYGAARVRLSRLRHRLVKLAAQHAGTLEGEDERTLRQFFRRANIKLTPCTPDADRPQRRRIESEEQCVTEKEIL